MIPVALKLLFFFGFEMIGERGGKEIRSVVAEAGGDETARVRCARGSYGGGGGSARTVGKEIRCGSEEEDVGVEDEDEDDPSPRREGNLAAGALKEMEKRLALLVVPDRAFVDPLLAPPAASISTGDDVSQLAGPIVCDFARQATHSKRFFFASPSTPCSASIFAPLMTFPRCSRQILQPHGASSQNVGLKQFHTAQGGGPKSSSAVAQAASRWCCSVNGYW